MNDISGLFLGSCRERTTGGCCPFVPWRGEGIDRLWMGEEVIADARSYSSLRSGGYATRDGAAWPGRAFSVEPECVRNSRASPGGPVSIPTRRSNAAGLSSLSDLSIFKGVLHFWQYIVMLPW